MPDFVHLHVHTTYSLLDGQCAITPLVKRAREWGMKALAVTDHGNLFALKAFYDACRSTNAKDFGSLPTIKPILGCEAYITNGKYLEKNKTEHRYHLILLAKNRTGYHNLVRLISEAHIHGFYHNPRIDHDLLEKYHEGLICSSACIAGEIAQALDQGRPDEAERLATWYKSVFGEDFYLEVMLHNSTKTNIPGATIDEHRRLYARQRTIAQGVFELGGKLSIPVIATNDVHFLDAADDPAHDVLLCLSTQTRLSDPSRMIYTGQEWFKDGAAMATLFPDHPEVIANTVSLAEKVEAYELDSPPIMPKFPIPSSFGTEEAYAQKYDEATLQKEFNTSDKPTNFDRLGGYEKVLRIKFEADYLASLVWSGASHRWGEPLSHEIKERIQFELDTVRTMGFPGYFLIVHDYIDAARQMGVWVGPGRGSAAGSAVAYALGITNVDPLKFDLLFERFLNPDRISMPDIDVDFDDSGRGRVLEYVTQKYGTDHVAHIVTFGQMAPKSAIKDVARAMEYPLPSSNRLASLVPDTPKINFEKALAQSPELAQEAKNETPFYSDNNPQKGTHSVAELLRFAKGLDGCVRQPGIHACGILISRDPLIDTLPVMPTPDEDLLCTQYDGHFVEPVGLLKMDFLGLKTLSVEKECVALIKKSHNLDLDPDKIPDDDAQTYALFSRGETTGLFQFESEGMKKYLIQLQPTRLSDLVAMNALYRPGPMAYIPTFIRRKKGEEPIAYDHPLMEKYLKDTYGVTVYQEQVMLLSRLLGGFTRGQSDKLRKAMGKKQIAVMNELKAKFVTGCLENPAFRIEKWTDEKTARELIDKIWDDWEAFASYAFNKSHAVCYAWIAYQTGYMKAHYPAEFMCAQISSEIGNFDKLPGFVAEAAAMGLAIHRPDVNKSWTRFAPIEGEHAISYALAGVRGVGELAAEHIVKEREMGGPYKGLLDFAMRLASTPVINKRVMEALVRCGAFDSFLTDYPGFHRARYFNNIPAVIKRAQARAKDRATGQMSLFDIMMPNQNSSDEGLTDCPQWAPAKCFKDERELCGIYLTGHPLGVYEKILPSLSTFSLAQMPEVPLMVEVNAQKPLRMGVRLAGMMKSCSIKMTKPRPLREFGKEVKDDNGQVVMETPQPFAILSIDDGSDNEISVSVYSKTYAKYKDWLSAEVDQPLLVCGELGHRIERGTQTESEELQLFAQEIYKFDDGIFRFSKAFHVNISYENENLEEIGKKLFELAQKFPGQVKLVVDLIWSNGNFIQIQVDVPGINLAPEFLTALAQMQGIQSYQLETIKDTRLEFDERRAWQRRRDQS